MLKKGYTLVELLVVILIMGIFLQLGFTSLRDFSRRQAAFSAARQVEGDIRFAQSLALSGNKPEGSVCDNINALFNGVRFQILTATSYEISTECSTGRAVIKTVTIDSNISLRSPSVNPIIFRPLARGTNVPTQTTIGVCTYAAGVGIQVTNSGEINQVSYSSCP